MSRSQFIEPGSFKRGTGRILQEVRSRPEVDHLKARLKARASSNHPVAALDTGGSINCIFRLSRRKEGKPLSIKLIE